MNRGMIHPSAAHMAQQKQENKIMHWDEKAEEQWFALEALHSKSGYNPLPAIKREEAAARAAKEAEKANAAA
jgi:hypothetical protein